MRPMLVPVLLAGALGGPCLAEVTLYSQPTVTDPALVGTCFYSSSKPMSSRNYKHADDFLIASGGTIDRVRWWGLSEGRFVKNLANVSHFTIEFYQAVPDAGGLLVGTLLSTATFPIAATNQTATGRLSAANQAIEYRHDVALSSPVQVAAGTPYFIAISARPVNANRDAWGWHDGLLVNGYSQIYSHNTLTWSSFQDTDSSFELFGTVPAPGGAGIVLLCGAVALRRRRPD